MKVKTFCKWCNNSLSTNHKGPCPKCGKEGKNIIIEPDPLKIKFILSPDITLEKIKNFYKENLKMLICNIIVTIILAILGLFFRGLPGFALSVFLGLLFIIFMPSWRIKIEQKDSHTYHTKIDK